MGTVVFFAAAESLLRVAYVVRNSLVTEIPLPSVIGDDYGPVPPWLDGLRILEPDRTLIWKNRPSLRRRYIDVFSPAGTNEERTAPLQRFLPTIPASFRDNPVWEIALNSEGFRDAEFLQGKRPSEYRIVCLGDSWTFGANVGQEQAWPQRLKTLLTHEFPGADFSVFNLGVLGYSSYQGLELLKQRALDLDPDVVIIGFAMNDSSVPGYRDRDMPGYTESISFPTRIARALHAGLRKIETYKLLHYLALLLREKPKSIGEHIRTEAAAAEGQWEVGKRRVFEQRDYEKVEPWTRVSPVDYEKNIRELIALAGSKNAGAILLFNELWVESPYRAILRKIAETERVPLVDSSALINEARRTLEDELETRLDLRPLGTHGPLPDGEIEVVFRVYLGARPVPRAVHIVGAHPKLGDAAPNQVAMYDDGTHGDQRAGDRVWSYAEMFPRGTRLVYVYTNSGREGKWEGLDVPHVRAFTVDAPHGVKTIYRPIESFGKIYMQADSWHTDAAGYELIAKAVLEKVRQDERFKRYVTQSLKAARSR